MRQPPMELLAVCLWQQRHIPPATAATAMLARAVGLLRIMVAEYGNFLIREGDFVRVLWTRIGRMQKRLAILTARFAAGTLAPTRPKNPASRRPPALSPLPPARGSATAGALATPIASGGGLPTRFGWLRQWIPVTTGPMGWIEQSLADPDLHALVAASPEAGRILRPLCHMLGIPRPACLARPKRARAEPADPPPPDQPRRPPPRTATRRPTPARRPPVPTHPFKTHPDLRHLWGASTRKTV